MKKTFVLVFVLIMCVLIQPAANLQAENNCPDHAYVARQEQANGETLVYCKCIQGFALNEKSACTQCTLEYVETLLSQYRAAIEGIQYSQTAFKSLAKAGVYGDIKSFIDLSEPTLAHLLIALATTQQKAVVAAVASVTVISKITKFWRESYGCRFENADLKTSCQNTRHFTEIAESKALQLKDCKGYGLSMRAKK